MNNADKAIAAIKKVLGKSILTDVAAHALYSGWQMGYCEFTEDKELCDVVMKYTCPYCRKFHSLKECSAYGVNEYRKLGVEAWKAKYHIKENEL